MKILPLFPFLISLSVCMSISAQGQQLLTLNVGGRTMKLIEDLAAHRLISVDCRSCQALRALQASAQNPLPLVLDPKHPPGSRACEERFFGRVVRGIDAQKNEYGLCLFADGSAVGLGSLAHANRELRHSPVKPKP